MVAALTLSIVFIKIFNYSVSPLEDRLETTISGVVLITTPVVKLNKGIYEQGFATGTGFFIGENLILTNYHVVAGNEPFGNTTNLFLYAQHSGKKYNATIIAFDKLSDVALIKIVDNEWISFKKEQRYSILKLDHSNNLRQGETVYSIGHPWGLNWSVSEGIISAIGRRRNQTPQYFIQTDAKIFNGNSGGPLINNEGNVVGMNSEIYVNIGGSYGFAIPGELLEKIVLDLQDEDKIVKWSSLGINFEFNDSGQLKITAVLPQSAAEAAGLKMEDVILSVYSKAQPGGNLITDSSDLLNILSILMEKDTITLEIKRKDIIKMIPVVLGGKTSEEFSQ